MNRGALAHWHVLRRQRAWPMPAWALCACFVARAGADVHGEGAAQPQPVPRWQLVQLAGRLVQPDSALQRAHLELDLTRSRYTGHAGCNHLMGALTVNPPHLRLGAPALTRMHCGELAMGQERQFIQALTHARSFEVQGPRLVLRDESGQALAGFIAARGP